MRKIYQPRVILLLVSAVVLLFCLFASTPENIACTAMVPCPDEVPAKATELLWESFSQQFVSSLAGY